MNKKQTDNTENEQKSQRRPRVKKSQSLDKDFINKNTTRKINKKTKTKSYFLPVSIAALLAISGVSYLSYSYFNQNKSNNINIVNSSMSNDTQVDKIQEQINNNSINIKNVNFNNGIVQDWTDEEQQKFINIIADNDINDNIRKSAKENINLDALLTYNKGNFSILNSKEIEELKKGYSNNTIGLKLNNKVISEITPYSSAWKNGLKIGDRILKINGNDVNSYSSEQIQNLLSNPKVTNSTWRFGSLGNYNIPALSSNIPYGDIAEIYVNNDILLLRINKINILTTQVIYELLQTKLNNNVNGFIIDLSNLKDINYRGIESLVWLLNGQKEVPIAKFIKNKQESMLYSSAPKINIDQNILLKINSLPKIVLINSGTAGSSEVLAHNISSSFIGTPSENLYFKNTLYNINNKHIVTLKDTIVTLPDGSNIRVTPKTNKQIVWPMFLYNQTRFR